MKLSMWVYHIVLGLIFFDLGAVNRGFSNPGGTNCFINATVQAISHAQPLTNYLLQEAKITQDQKGTIVGLYKNLLNDLQRDSKDLIDPTSFRQHITLGIPIYPLGLPDFARKKQPTSYQVFANDCSELLSAMVLHKNFEQDKKTIENFYTKYAKTYKNDDGNTYYDFFEELCNYAAACLQKVDYVKALRANQDVVFIELLEFLKDLPIPKKFENEERYLDILLANSPGPDGIYWLIYNVYHRAFLLGKDISEGKNDQALKCYSEHVAWLEKSPKFIERLESRIDFLFALVAQLSKYNTLLKQDLRRAHPYGRLMDIAMRQDDAYKFLDPLLEALSDFDLVHIGSLFNFDLMSRITCGTCGYISTASTQQYILSLSIPRDTSIVTLENCLEASLKNIALTGENQWKCPICNKKVDAQQNHSIRQSLVPKILVMHIKRFRQEVIFDTAGSPTNVENKKLDTPVQIPLTFDCNNFMDSSPTHPIKYRLRSFVLHSGSLDFGHYTAFARDDTVVNIDQQWAYFNDLADIAREPYSYDAIKKITETGVLRLGSYDSKDTSSDKSEFHPYILVYELVENKESLDTAAIKKLWLDRQEKAVKRLEDKKLLDAKKIKENTEKKALIREKNKILNRLIGALKMLSEKLGTLSKQLMISTKPI